MGSLVKLFDSGKTSMLYRACSVIFPQINRSITEANNSQKKRPASAFASFFREKQGSLKEENPHLRQPELMKLASTLWSNEHTHIKQQFKNEFARKMEEYREVNKVRKRPVPPYVKFFQDNHRMLQIQYPNLIDRARQAGRMWNALSDDEKEEYRAMYTREMGEFHMTDEEKEILSKKRKALNKQRERKDIRRFGKAALKERPKPPINNAFSMFVRMHSSEVPREQNVFQHLGERWRNMDSSEKVLYKQKLDDAMEKYEQELSEWQQKHDKRGK